MIKLDPKLLPALLKDFYKEGWSKGVLLGFGLAAGLLFAVVSLDAWKQRQLARSQTQVQTRSGVEDLL